MMVKLSAEEILQTEVRVLQAICQETREASVRESARHILKDYRWRDPIHQAIFGCLLELAGAAPEIIREQLAARVTRKGFPDVNWQEFFKPHALTKHEAERLVSELGHSA